MDWFRFYSETIRDGKIRRVARKAGETPLHVIGVWSVLLSIASESQQRGTLLLGNDPVTVDDIEDVTGCNVSETLQEMIQVGMLAFDGEVYSIPAWGKRQYESDNSTPRVQKHRQHKKQSETLQERFRNAPETETETYTETETETGTPSRSQMTKQYEAVLGMVPTASYPEMTHYMDKLINASAADWWALALQETTGARRPGWQYMKAILESWLAAGQPSHTNGKGKSVPTGDADNRPRVPAMPADVVTAADARQAEYERQEYERLVRAGAIAA